MIEKIKLERMIDDFTPGDENYNLESYEIEWMFDLIKRQQKMIELYEARRDEAYKLHVKQTNSQFREIEALRATVIQFYKVCEHIQRKIETKEGVDILLQEMEPLMIKGFRVSLGDYLTMEKEKPPAEITDLGDHFIEAEPNKD